MGFEQVLAKVYWYYYKLIALRDTYLQANPVGIRGRFAPLGFVLCARILSLYSLVLRVFVSCLLCLPNSPKLWALEGYIHTGRQTDKQTDSPPFIIYFFLVHIKSYLLFFR